MWEFYVYVASLMFRFSITIWWSVQLYVVKIEFFFTRTKWNEIQCFGFLMNGKFWRLWHFVLFWFLPNFTFCDTNFKTKYNFHNINCRYLCFLYICHYSQYKFLMIKMIKCLCFWTKTSIIVILILGRIFY